MDKRLQYHMINLIKNLCRFDRNQQIMSSDNFVDDILVTCTNVLNDENMFLINRLIVSKQCLQKSIMNLAWT